MNENLFEMPKLDICQVPMGTDRNGKLYFCQEPLAVSLFDFELHIRANGDEWELEDLFFGNDLLGLQRVLPGPFFDLIENELAKRFEDDIQSHIDEHLPEAVAESLRRVRAETRAIMGRLAS